MINGGVIQKKSSFGYTCGELKEYWFGSYFSTILSPVENTFCLLVPMVAWITDYYCSYERPDQALILDTISIQQFNFSSDPLWTEKGFFESCVIGLPRLVQFCGLHFAVTESQHKYQRKFGAKFLSWKCYDSVRFVGVANAIHSGSNSCLDLYPFNLISSSHEVQFVAKFDAMHHSENIISIYYIIYFTIFSSEWAKWRTTDANN